MSIVKLTPADLHAFIERHELRAELIELSVPAPTVEAAAGALGVDASRILKSLLFWAGEDPLLVLASGPTLVDRRALADDRKIGRKKVKLMPPGDVLRVSGYPIGGLPPFGLRQPVTTLMDERILMNDMVYAGGGADNTLMQVTPSEIQRTTGAVVRNLQEMPIDPQSPHA